MQVLREEFWKIRGKFPCLGKKMRRRTGKIAALRGEKGAAGMEKSAAGRDFFTKLRYFLDGNRAECYNRKERGHEGESICLC